MRSRQTNFLQVTVIIAGLVYILMGISMFLSPIFLIELFSSNVSESWLELIKQNDLVAPLYTMLRGLSALLFTVGLSNVMPLFEPERYRGLIYYNNVIFPGIAVALFTRYSIGILLNRQVPGGEQVLTLSQSLAEMSGHLLIPLAAILMLVIFGLTVTGLYITRNEIRKS